MIVTPAQFVKEVSSVSHFPYSGFSAGENRNYDELPIEKEMYGTCLNIEQSCDQIILII